MITNAKTVGLDKVRPATNRIIASIIALLAFITIVTPTFGQGSSTETTLHLGESVDPASQISVENMLTGNDLYAGASMTAQLFGGEELNFAVSGLETPIEEGMVVAVVHVTSEGQTRTFVFSGGGGGGGYIIGIEDL